jgi:hypothetical protein
MVGCYFAKNGYEMEHIIDETVGSYDQEELMNRLQTNFEQSANRFKRKNGIGSFGSLQGSLLDESAFAAPEYISEWSSFYERYTVEKGLRLRNYQIGYKKGQEGNG